MTYPSETFTRTLIMFSVKHFTKNPEIQNKIDTAIAPSSSNVERRYYFSYGASLFYTIGYCLIVLSLFATVASIIILHWISFAWIIFVYPGWFFYLIALGFRERLDEVETATNYSVSYSATRFKHSIINAFIFTFLIVGALQVPEYVFDS